MSAAQLSLSVIIGAALGAGFAQKFSLAGTSIEALQKKAQELSKNHAQLTALQKLQNTVGATGTRMEAARERVRQLYAQMKQTKSPTAALRSEFARAQQDAGKLQSQFMQQRSQLAQMSSSMQKAGIDTRNLAGEQAKAAQQIDKMTQAQNRLQDAQAKYNATKEKLSFGNFKADLIAAGAGAMALRAPIMESVNFEQAMKRATAIGGADNTQSESMRQLALQLGRDTQFSAEQMAASMENLARAGLRTDEILASMTGMVNMAAVEGMDLASSADIAASTLRGFNLSAEQTTHVSDVLTKASAISNTNIRELGEAMKYAAPIAAGLAIPMEETAAMIGMMSDAGIKGSMAGTALSGGLMRLSKEPKQAADALEELGIALTDRKGNLVKMPILMNQLAKATANMGKKQKMEHLTKIFGGEAAKGMLALLNAVQSGKYDEKVNALMNSDGFAAEMATDINNTTAGSMRVLASAWSDLLIAIGDSGIRDGFRWLVDGITSAVAAISAFVRECPNITAAFSGLLAGFSAYKGAKVIYNFGAALFNLHSDFLALKGAQTAVAEASGIVAQKSWLASAATKAWTGIQAAFNAVMSANPVALVILAIAALVAAVWYLYENWDTVCEWFKTAWSGVSDFLSASWNVISAGFSALWDGVKSSFSAAWDFIKGGISAVGDGLSAVWQGAVNWWNGTDEMTPQQENAMLRKQVEELTILNKMSDGFAERVAEMTAAWRPFRTSLADGFSEIFNIMRAVGSIITTEIIPAITNLTTAMTSGVITSASSLGVEIAAHAKGGIFSSPHVGMIGEAGAEAVIPLTDRSRGIPLLNAAASSLGVGGGVYNSTPNITINVSGADGDIAGRIKQAVLDALEEAQDYSMRVAFA